MHDGKTYQSGEFFKVHCNWCICHYGKAYCNIMHANQGNNVCDIVSRVQIKYQSFSMCFFLFLFLYFDLSFFGYKKNEFKMLCFKLTQQIS